MDLGVPMHTLAQHGNWVLCQYQNNFKASLFIYSTINNKVFGSYPKIDDDDLIDDWYNLTKEG